MRAGSRTVLSLGAVVLGIVAVGGHLLPHGVAAAPPEAPRSAPHRFAWGVYQIYWGPERFEKALDAELPRLASPPDYIMFYRDLGRPFPRRAVQAIRDRGAVPIISLELCRWHRAHVRYLPKINAGEFDAFFEAWARAARACGGRVLLRFGFEFNGEWFNWSLDPQAYRAAWRRARAIFARVQATNVEWIWSPNVVSVPDEPENDMHLYYPGDDQVEWIGVDGYNWGDRHDRWHKWQSCADVFGPVLKEFARRYPRHPVMLAEFACVGDTPGRKARWIREAYAWLSSRPRVSAAIWFNHDKRAEGEYDWRVSSSDAALTAFNATFAAP